MKSSVKFKIGCRSLITNSLGKYAIDVRASYCSASHGIVQLHFIFSERNLSVNIGIKNVQFLHVVVDGVLQLMFSSYMQLLMVSYN